MKVPKSGAPKGSEPEKVETHDPDQSEAGSAARTPPVKPAGQRDPATVGELPPGAAYAPRGPGNVDPPDPASSAIAVRARLGQAAGPRGTGGSGPIDFDSAAGKSALQKVRAALPRSPTAVGGASSHYEPLRATVDDLGMTHIRLQRHMGGIPIFGEHVNAQIRPGGRVSFSGTPTEALAPQAPVFHDIEPVAATAVQAARTMMQDEYSITDSASMQAATPVYWRHRRSDGTSSLRRAFHVQMADFSVSPVAAGRERPVLANCVVDAFSGEVLAHWDQLHRRHSAKARTALSLEQGSNVNAPVGPQSATVNLSFSRDLTVDSALLRLGTPSAPGIEHTWRGDVVIKVTAPDGTSTEFAPHDANDSADDVSGVFDLSRAFRGVRARGSWTVEFSDRFAGADGGTVRRVDLALEGPAVTPPPEAPPSGPGDDFAPFVGRVDLQTTTTDRGFELRTPDGRVETRDAQAQDPNRVAGRFDLGVPFTDADNTWGGTNATIREFAAIETHHSATTFLPFLEEVFNLDSLDDRGMKLEALSNVGVRFNNAFWFRDIFHIGHGDGRIFDRLSTVDIVAHELAHGITEKSANLIYDNQSGGLNESFSDIVGTMFEWWSARQPGAQEAGVLPFDWKVGEDTFTPQGPDDDALRSMKDPLSDGISIDHFGQYDDSVDVHFSSGIQNNAFYLAVQGGQHRLGGQVDGLRNVFGNFDDAILAAGRVWMRALQFYLTPGSGFSDARVATDRAARDLFPDRPEVARTIDQAWTAVGVPDRRPAVA